MIENPTKNRSNVVVDPGFPRGAPTPEEPIFIWQNFWQKIHENERNWTERQSASPVPP